MKIVWVVPAIFIAGGIRIVLEYANRLQRLGHEVHVISRRPLPETPCFPVEVPVWLESDMDRVCANADAVVATALDTVKPVLRCSTTGRRYYFVQNRESYFVESPRVQSMVESLYSLPLIPITISHWLEAVIRLHGKESYVIHNGLDTNVFQEVSGIRPNHKRVVAEGQWTPWKRLDLGIAAARQSGADEVVALSVKAKPDGVDTLYADVASEEIARIYSSSTAMVKLPDFEGYPCPQSEAMACGCTVVTSCSPGTIEYCSDGVNSLVVPPGDADAAADALCRLKDPTLLGKIVEGGKRTVIERFGWDDKIRAMELALSGNVSPRELKCPYHDKEEQEHILAASWPYTLPLGDSLNELARRVSYVDGGIGKTISRKIFAFGYETCARWRR